MHGTIRAMGLVALIVLLAALPACATQAGAEGALAQPQPQSMTQPVPAAVSPAAGHQMAAPAATPAGQAGEKPAAMDCPMMQKMKEMQAQGGMKMDCPMMEKMMAGRGQDAQLKSDNPVIKAYAEASARMHKDMASPLTGDADRDFLKGMVPHHQGAIDMARVVLKYGKDPKIKKLARRIIAAQEKEIALMNGWLSSGDGKKTKIPETPAPTGHSGH